MFTLPNGYISKTTFMMDFDIADRFGKAAVLDTYKRAFAEWKSNVEYLTELVIVLNLKIWEHYEKNEPLARLYNSLWDEAQTYAYDNLTGDDLTYFWKCTD